MQFGLWAQRVVWNCMWLKKLKAKSPLLIFWFCQKKFIKSQNNVYSCSSETSWNDLWITVPLQQNCGSAVWPSLSTIILALNNAERKRERKGEKEREKERKREKKRNLTLTLTQSMQFALWAYKVMCNCMSLKKPKAKSLISCVREG